MHNEQKANYIKYHLQARDGGGREEKEERTDGSLCDHVGGRLLTTCMRLHVYVHMSNNDVKSRLICGNLRTKAACKYNIMHVTRL